MPNENPVTEDDLIDVKTELLERIDAGQTYLLDRIDKLETTLLKGFRKWAMRSGFWPMNVRQRVFVPEINERLDKIEDRLAVLDARLKHLEMQ